MQDEKKSFKGCPDKSNLMNWARNNAINPVNLTGKIEGKFGLSSNNCHFFCLVKDNNFSKKTVGQYDYMRLLLSGHPLKDFFSSCKVRPFCYTKPVLSGHFKCL